MMICKNCGSEIPEGSLFCTACGQRVVASGDEYFAPGYDSPAESAYGGYEPPADPAYVGYEPPADPAVGYEPPVYGGYDAPNYSDFDAPAAVEDFGVNTAPEKPKGKGLKLGLLLGSLGLVLVVGIVIVCVMMMFGGPVTDIAMAYEDLLKGGNYTFESTSDGKTTVTMVNIDKEEREITLYQEVDGKFQMGIYDGYLIITLFGEYYSMDWSDYEELVFNMYEDFDAEKIDWEELLDLAGEDAYDEACEHVDFDALNDCLVTYFKIINDEDWLEENAGFSQKEKRGVTYYTFEPDVYEFCSVSVTEFEDAFVDPDEYEQFRDKLDDYEDELEDVELTISFGLEDGNLVSLEMEAEKSGERISERMEIVDVGETEIDTDELEDILDDSEGIEDFYAAMFDSYDFGYDYDYDDYIYGDEIYDYFYS